MALTRRLAQPGDAAALAAFMQAQAVIDPIITENPALWTPTFAADCIANNIVSLVYDGATLVGMTAGSPNGVFEIDGVGHTANVYNLFVATGSTLAKRRAVAKALVVAGVDNMRALTALREYLLIPIERVCTSAALVMTVLPTDATQLGGRDYRAVPWQRVMALIDGWR